MSKELHDALAALIVIAAFPILITISIKVLRSPRSRDSQKVRAAISLFVFAVAVPLTLLYLGGLQLFAELGRALIAPLR